MFTSARSRTPLDEVIAALPHAAHTEAEALVVEDDPAVAKVCTRQLARLGVRARVVWTRADALERLSRADRPLAFAYVSRCLREGSGEAVIEDAARTRPGMPVVVGESSIAEVLGADGVVLCRPFTAEQFDAAFDAAVLREQANGYADGFPNVADGAELLTA